ITPQISLYGVLANLLVTVAVLPITVCGLGAMLVYPFFSAGGEKLMQVASWGSSYVDEVARMSAELPGSAQQWPEGVGGIALICLLLATGAFFLIWLARGRHRFAAGGMAATVVLVSVIVVLTSPPAEKTV